MSVKLLYADFYFRQYITIRVAAIGEPFVTETLKSVLRARSSSDCGISSVLGAVMKEMRLPE